MPDDAPIVAIIDDDKIFQLTAAKTLIATALTDKILQFLNGEDALDFLKGNIENPMHLPDFVFLDINMPFVDGWMFLEDYAAIKPKLSKPIVIYMVSSSIDPRDIDRAKKNSEVSGYVIKPVTREKFIELLQRAA
jgi:two-component system, chemotaxis family, chemotaxis protein CheY